MARRKKHSLVSIPRNRPKAKHCINWWNLLSLNSISTSRLLLVKHSRDGAADMNGVHKGLSTRMEECSPLGIYVHCYGHVLKLALQDTMTQILEPGSVQLLRSESPTTRPVWQHRSRRWRSETDAEVIPVGSREGCTRTNGTHCKSSAHAVFRQRSKNLLWEQSFIDCHLWLGIYLWTVCVENNPKQHQ